jgi:hypothetical protein
LHTILDVARDRRGVSRWLAALTVLVTGSAAFSLAMLHAADGQNGDASAVTQSEQPDKGGDNDAAPAPVQQVRQQPVQQVAAAGDSAPAKEGKIDKPVSTPPENHYVDELFKTWRASARSDGKIPGGLIGMLGAKVEEFVSNNRNDASGAPYAKKVEPILPRFDASRDWPPDEALALLIDLAALSDIPLLTRLEADAEANIQSGEPLSPELENAAPNSAPWGEPTADGLWAARPLDPRADSYPVGTALRSRILLHNGGKVPVLVRAKSFMQPGYTAHDAMGNPLHVESTYWLTLGRVQTWRLAPGEFCEMATPGFGVGKDSRRDEWANVRVGSWIDVADGVDVILSPGSVETIIDDGPAASTPASGSIAARTWANGRKLKREIIRERLERELPLPASAADRELVVRRVTKDIFGGEPTADEIAAFVVDESDDPFGALGERCCAAPAWPHSSAS